MIDNDRVEMEKVPYASAIGSLMYTQVFTCPDIAFLCYYFREILKRPNFG